MTDAVLNDKNDNKAPWAVAVPRTPDECRKSAHFEHYSSRYDTIDDITHTHTTKQANYRLEAFHHAATTAMNTRPT